MKKKWTLREFGILFWTLVLLVSAGFLGYTTVKSTKEVIKAKTPTIALVNEDISSSFNGKNYNFGKDFVNQVSNDDKYEWQVVSRSVATKAFENGTVDAVIYLPQSFSKDILTFQNLNPTKANVEYKVQAKSDRLTATILQDEIVATLHKFNNNVVEMYYASVANSLAEAENQMNASLQNQEVFVNKLTEEIKAPFENMASQYGGLVSSTNILNTLNKSTVTAQNSFVTSTTNILKQTSSGLNGQLTSVDQFIKNYQNSLNQTILTAQGAIKKQGEEDFQKFSALKVAMDGNLAAFYQEPKEPKDANDPKKGNPNDGTKDPALNALEKKIKEYKGKLTEATTLLNSQKKDLTKERDNLIKLEKKLYNQFFDQEIELTVDSKEPADDLQKQIDQLSFRQTDENARIALAKKLSKSFGGKDILSSTAYMSQLNDLVQSISVNPADYQLDSLVANGVLNEEQKQSYVSRLQLIAQYAQAFGLGSRSDFNMAPAPEEGTEEQLVKKTLSITVPASDSYQSSSLPSGVTSVQAEGGSIKLDNTTSTEAKNFQVVLEVKLSSLVDGQFTLEWKDKDGNTALKSVEVFVLYPKGSKADFYKYIATEKFADYMSYFQNVEKIAQMITVLFGKPGATYDSLLGETTADGFKNASSESVYAMYGNIQISTIVDRLAAEDVKEFREVGESNLKELGTTIVKLDSMIKELNDKLESLEGEELPDNYFNTEMTKLKEWYVVTKTTLEENFNRWNQDRRGGVLPNNGLSSGITEDRSLYNQFKLLSDSTSRTADAITSNSKAIENHSQQFENLVTSAKSIESNAQTVVKNANSLTASSQTDLKENRAYKDAFSKILVNTRTQGVNTNQLYSFFANPLQITDKSSKVVDELPKKKDYTWILIFIIGLSLGAVTTMVVGCLRGRRTVA